MLKKCIFGLFALICCIFITGCSTVTSSVKLHIQNDGSVIIEQNLKVQFDKDAIQAAGYDYDSIVDTAYDVAVEYLDAFHYEYNSRKEEYITNEKMRKYFGLFGSSYNQDVVKDGDGFYVYRHFPSIYDFLLYNNYPILYIGCPHCEEKIADNESQAASLTKCPNCQEDINIVQGEDIIDGYDYFIESRIIDIPFTGEITYEKQDFTTKYSAEVLTVYKDLANLVNKRNEPLVAKLEYLFSSYSYTIDDVKLKFEFLTPYGRVHSNGQVSKSGVYYVHSWDIDDVNDPIILYREAANVTIWYIVALVIALGVTVVLLIFSLVKKRLYDKSKVKKDNHNNLIDIIR